MLSRINGANTKIPQKPYTILGIAAKYLYEKTEWRFDNIWSKL